MTQTEALKLALDYIIYRTDDPRKVIETIEKALMSQGDGAQQSNEQVEPVAWLVEFENGEQELHFEEQAVGETNTPLYTHSPVPTAQPKEPEQEPVAVTAEMARAFHRAISDGPLGQADEFEIQTGLEAAFAHITTPPQPAQPEQEPVAWRIWNPDGEKQYAYSENGDGEPLYTTPPQRKPLTDEEIDRINLVCPPTQQGRTYRAFAKAIEAAHGIKEQQ